MTAGAVRRAARCQGLSGHRQDVLPPVDHRHQSRRHAPHQSQRERGRNTQGAGCRVPRHDPRQRSPGLLQGRDRGPDRRSAAARQDRPFRWTCAGSTPSSIARPSSSWAASNPPHQAIEALARPFTATDPEPFLPVGEYVLQTRGRRTARPARTQHRRGAGSLRPPLPVHAGANPRGRDGPGNRPRTTDLQPPEGVRAEQPPFDLTVDRVMTWPEMRPSQFVRAFARHGVLAALTARPNPLFFRPVQGSKNASEAIAELPKKQP